MRDGRRGGAVQALQPRRRHRGLEEAGPPSGVPVIRVSILGLGLIGGSAGLAWRAAGHHVTGWARRAETAQSALECGAIDTVAGTLEGAAAADVVVLAPPVLAVRDLLVRLAPYLAPGVIVTDVASTKAVVERWALALLPRHARFVGSHPMAGKETAGIEHADGGLFRNRTWVVVPPPGADTAAVAAVTQLAQDSGARTMTLDAATHDRAVAAVSHLPFMASIAIAQSVIERETFAQLAPVAGTGLRDMTRLTSGDALMHRDICATNRDNLAAELDRYAAQLAQLADMVRQLPDLHEEPSDSRADITLTALGERFAALKAARDGWLAGG